MPAYAVIIVTSLPLNPAQTQGRAVILFSGGVYANYIANNGAWESVGSGGAHPNLATHDALGLATDAELTTHAATSHGVTTHGDAEHTALNYEASGAVATHAAAADPHAGYRLESAAIVEANLGLTDLTTANASQTAHGFLPKLPGGTSTFLRADGAFAAPTAAAGISQTEIDFGVTLVSEASFLITDANVSAGSKIIGSVAYVAPTGKDLDELDMDGLDLKFAPGAGQFTLYARGMDGYVADKFRINYMVGA